MCIVDREIRSSLADYSHPKYPFYLLVQESLLFNSCQSYGCEPHRPKPLQEE